MAASGEKLPMARFPFRAFNIQLLALPVTHPRRAHTLIHMSILAGHIIIRNTREELQTKKK